MKTPQIEVDAQDAQSTTSGGGPNWNLVGAGGSDVFGALGAIYSTKYARDFQRKAFWSGVADARRIMMSDYAALYRRADEEALAVQTEIDQMTRAAQFGEGEVAVAAGAAGLSGQSMTELRDNVTRSMLLQEGIARKNLVLVNQQINAELDAARWRARARMIEAAGMPMPSYGSAYLQATVGAAKIAAGAL